MSSEVEPSDTLAGGVVSHFHLPTLSDDSIPQRALELDLAPYVVANGVPRDKPMFGAHASSVAYKRNWSTTMGLQAANSISLNSTARWLPDVADVVPRADLGSDMSGWKPHWGNASQFTFHAASAPYVDSDYSYWASGNRRKTEAAMIFHGNEWMQNVGLGTETDFTFIIVAVIHYPQNKAWHEVLASPSAATDARKATDCVLRYRDGWIESHTDKTMYSRTRLHPPLQYNRLRPTALIWGAGPQHGMLGVVDAHGRYYHEYRHSHAGNYDTRFYLGVNGGVPTAAYASYFDILDMAYYDHRLSAHTAHLEMKKLDHAYGISGR